MTDADEGPNSMDTAPPLPPPDVDSLPRLVLPKNGAVIWTSGGWLLVLPGSHADTTTYAET